MYAQTTAPKSLLDFPPGQSTSTFHKSLGLMIHGQILNVANPLPLTCKPAPKRQEQLHEIPLQINALRAWPVGLGCNWVHSLLKGGIPRSKTIYPSYEYSAKLHPLITVDHVGWNPQRVSHLHGYRSGGVFPGLVGSIYWSSLGELPRLVPPHTPILSVSTSPTPEAPRLWGLEIAPVSVLLRCPSGSRAWSGRPIYPDVARSVSSGPVSVSHGDCDYCIVDHPSIWF